VQAVMKNIFQENRGLFKTRRKLLLKLRKNLKLSLKSRLNHPRWIKSLRPKMSKYNRKFRNKKKLLWKPLNNKLPNQPRRSKPKRVLLKSLPHLLLLHQLRR